MNILHREWDESINITTPEGTHAFNLHRIDLELDFNTAFMFDRHSQDGRTRRAIITTIRADHMGEEVNFDEPYVPIEMSLQEQNLQEYITAVFALTRQHGFDGATPEQCIHGLHITAKMPNRHTGQVEDVHSIALLPEPRTWKDLILFAPASTVIR